MRHRLLLLIALAACAMAWPVDPAHAQSADAAPGWRFSLAPYVWLPAVKTSLRYDLPAELSGAAHVDADPGNYLSDLNGALLLAGTAGYGRFSAFTDIMYMGIGSTGSRVRSVDIEALPRNPISSQANLDGSTDIRTAMWTLGAGYTVIEAPWGMIDLFAGFRWVRVKAETDYNLALQIFGPRGNAGPSFGGAGSLSGTQNILNGIVGVRGRIRLGGSAFFVPYYLDIGTGDSTFTWQTFAGLGYQTGWADVEVGYRYLSLDQGGTSLVQDMSLSGAYLAVNFRF